MKKLAVALAALVGSIGASTAADIPAIVVPTAPAVVVPAVPARSPLAGFYLGAGVGLNVDRPPFEIDAVYLSTVAGYNFVRNRLLIGAEVEGVAFLVSPIQTAVSINARAGFLLGDRALLYSEVGVFLAAGVPFWALGGGIEFVLGERFSVFAETSTVFRQGAIPFGEEFMVDAGIVFHFGGR